MHFRVLVCRSNVLVPRILANHSPNQEATNTHPQTQTHTHTHVHTHQRGGKGCTRTSDQALSLLDSNIKNPRQTQAPTVPLQED
jgi:hypothetical protein